jgi:hypothetical protein
MSTRTLGVALLLVLSVGCASARPAVAVARSAPPEDMDRWARAACHRGEYPIDLDARAFAQARMFDRAAQRQGGPVPGATQQLLDQRSVFETRCESWLRVAQLNL